MEEEKQEEKPAVKEDVKQEEQAATKLEEKPPEQPGEVMVEKGKVRPEQMKEIEQGEFLTIPQLAAKLAYGKSWITYLIQRGRIKGIKVLGGQWRIPRSEYERLIKEGLPPLPRMAIKPPITELEVTEKAQERIIEPERKEEEAKPKPGLFLDFFGTFKRKE